MSQFVSAAAKRFPFLAEFSRQVSNPTKTLPELRSELNRMRAEYWYRRMAEFPGKIGQAQNEAISLWNTKLSQPETWTWGDAVSAGVVGIQLLGAFCLGEVIGRGSLVGYTTSADQHH